MLTQEQFNELSLKLGDEAAKKIKTEFATLEKSLNDKNVEVIKGLLKSEDFEKFKTDEIAKLQETLKKVEDATKEQGTIINALKETATPEKPKTLEDVLADKKVIDEIKAVLKAGTGVVEIPLDGIIVKTAGITSIGNTVQPMSNAPNSPYLPVAGPVDANNFYGIMYNPNFIINYVNRGSTNFSLLPWVNETSVEGAADFVQEGAQKPLWNTRFKVEMSQAKKIAAMSTITEEFDQDLPGFTTIVKRLLTEEVTRKWDDAIYTGVIGVAKPYTLTYYNGQVDDSNLYDALRVGIAQIGNKNYTANFIGVNPLTSGLIDMQKSATDRLYLTPPFLPRLSSILREGNKVATDMALVGDIRQYNVDTYKDMVLKVGYNMDDFRRNQFSVIAEARYHDYISDIRKDALAYYNLKTVRAQIDSGS